MSFKFNQEYVDLMCKHEEEFRKEGFEPPASILEAYLDWMEGNALCACDHGCNQTSAENAAKMSAIIRVLITEGYDKETMDTMALKDPNSFAHELHEEMWERAETRRETKG